MRRCQFGGCPNYADELIRWHGYDICGECFDAEYEAEFERLNSKRWYYAWGY